MKQIILVVAILAVGLYAYIRFTQSKKPPEEPPPPPPVIELPPPQVLSEEELERVKSATIDSDPQVRWEALQLLVTSQDTRAEDIMVHMLHHDADAQIRKNIIGILANRKGPKITENLIAMLKDMDSEVRHAALDALGRIGDPSTAPAITEAMRDTDERVRLTALTILKNMQEARNRDIEEKRRQQEEALRQHEEMLRQQQGGKKK
ncbi:MAG: HEAT repeat domain-containing protein [Elusimicrobia bacterium]|nr:HEAT repeat domain-containing protein [Elusimicrobiota bacterium]